MGNKKKIVHRSLTMEDMQGIKPANTLLDNLLLVAGRALEIYDDEEAAFKREHRRAGIPAASNDNFVKTDARKRPVANPDRDLDWFPTSSTAARGQSPLEQGKQRTKLENGPNPPPPLPPQFMDKIHEVAHGRNISEPKPVIQKSLYQTDVSESHNRLSIPFNQIVYQGFLREEEREFLCEKRNGKSSNCYPVPIIEPCLGEKVVSVNLSRWDMKKGNGGKTSSSYVLNGTWNLVVRRNELKEGTVVQLWAFRIDQELWLALVKLPNLD